MNPYRSTSAAADSLPSTTARATQAGAAIRAGVGVALLVAPTRFGGHLIGDAAATDGTKVFARQFGARDLALGLGTLLAIRRSSGVRGWLVASALADGLDAVANLLAYPRLGKRTLMPMAIAVGSALAGASAARQVRSTPVRPG